MKETKKGDNYSTRLVKSAANMVLILKKATKTWTLPSLIFLLLVFICICAVIFSHLESKNDQKLYQKYQGKKLEFLEKYNITEKELQELMNELSYMKKKGFHTSYKNFWGFYHSFWFTITVITTMGKQWFFCQYKATFYVCFRFLIDLSIDSLFVCLL